MDRVLNALKGLDVAAQSRVIAWADCRIGSRMLCHESLVPVIADKVGSYMMEKIKAAGIDKDTDDPRR